MLAGFGYLGAAILSVAQLYDMNRALWAGAWAWAGFLAETLWLIGRVTGLVAPDHLTVTDYIAVFVWVVVGVYLTMARRLGLTALGAFLFPIVFLLWLAGLLTSGWFVVFTSLGWMGINLGLAAVAVVTFLLMAVFGIMYIEKERELAEKQIRLFYYQLPALDDMDWWMARLSVWGWSWFTLTLIVGRFATGGAGGFGLSPIASFAVWVIYALLLAGRLFWHWRGHRAAVGSMLAFVGVLVDLFAVGAIGHHVSLW